MLCLHFASWKFYHSAHLLLLLLLAGPGSTLVLGPGRVRAGAEGRLRSVAEGKVRSAGKVRGVARASVEDNTETKFEDARLPETDDGMWGDSGTGLGSMLFSGEGGQWEPRSSSRCVPIPSGMALCQNIGYDTMRMPNLLGHESPAEAVQQSASWLPLLARECHPDARIFLCSLFAPICLDR